MSGVRLHSSLSFFLLWLLHAHTILAQEETVLEGVASYYAEEFHGRKTASGEIYDMRAMTAAHQTLPFNTFVRVINMENGKSVVVRINDAGPFKDDRIIDLSRAAAEELELIKDGTAKVRLEIVKPAKGAESNGLAANKFYTSGWKKAILSGFAIQLGSFSNKDNLTRYMEEMKRKGIAKLYIQIALVNGAKIYRLIIGGFSTRMEAEESLAGLRKKNLDGFVFQIR